MKILVLGCSSLFRRRILPVLHDLSNVTAVDVASRRGALASADLDLGDGCRYSDLAEALRRSDAEVVYVSLENASHMTWVTEILASGRHVMVDKPAFLDHDSALRLVEFACKRGLVLAEMTVFLDHPRIDQVDVQMDDLGSLRRVQACFSFPPLEPTNFRYDAERGGGALNDLGPYAAATARYFFAEEPREIQCSALTFRPGGNVEIAFNVTAFFDNGGCFSGQFGFDTEYQNWINAVGLGGSLRMDRVFTPPPDFAGTIEMRAGNATRMLECETGDCFALMITRVLDRIRDRDPHELYDALLADSLFRNRMRRAMTESRLNGD